MRYTFGKCRLDVASRELLRDGEAVHLSPKAFDLLCALIDERPRVLSKTELMGMLWPDTFVVEANLPVIVGELRTALGDRSADISAIKTHHGIGYSFVADVRQSRAGADTSEITGIRWILRSGGRRMSLGRGVNIVGRDEECDVYLNDASVSRHHARISVSADGIAVDDTDSKNGTRVNGKRITEVTTLADGDQIEFGSVATTLVASRVDDPSTLTL